MGSARELETNLIKIRTHGKKGSKGSGRIRIRIQIQTSIRVQCVHCPCPCLLSMDNAWVILNNHNNNNHNNRSTVGSLRINSFCMALQLPFEHDKR